MRHLSGRFETEKNPNGRWGGGGSVRPPLGKSDFNLDKMNVYEQTNLCMQGKIHFVR